MKPEQLKREMIEQISIAVIDFPLETKLFELHWHAALASQFSLSLERINFGQVGQKITIFLYYTKHTHTVFSLKIRATNQTY